RRLLQPQRPAAVLPHRDRSQGREVPPALRASPTGGRLRSVGVARRGGRDAPPYGRELPRSSRDKAIAPPPTNRRWRMPKPDPALVVKWRELADEGYLYAEIARMYPEFSVDQVRHYCLGHTGRSLGGPIQRVDRWYGSNVWLRGENSPHSSLTEKQARKVLDDW